jgi:hypothetical protein
MIEFRNTNLGALLTSPSDWTVKLIRYCQEALIRKLKRVYCVPTEARQEALNMNIFEYFYEEVRDIEEKLVETTNNYEIWTREQVFDHVKVVCDEIMGHLKKQTSLLLNNLNEQKASLNEIMVEAQKDHRLVEDEIGQLTQVHVDEPNYQESLRNLLKVLEQHIAFSRRLYAKVKETATPQELELLNSRFNNVLLHSTDFNSLQAS